MKKLFRSALILFSLSGLVFSFISLDKKEESINEDSFISFDLNKASYSELRWNNVDYGGYATFAGRVPNDGYCCLIGFDGFTSTVTDTTNMATSSFDIGSKFKVNGVPIKDMDGSLIYYHYAGRGHVYFYFRDSEVTYTGDYQRITVEIEDGTVFNNMELPYVKLVFQGILGTSNAWVVAPNVEKTEVSFVGFSGNNTDNGNYGGKQGLMLRYSANFSNVSFEVNGGIKNRNLRDTNLGNNIFYNGTPFKDIPNSEIMYFNETRLWLYIPNWTSEVYNYIKINSCTIMDAILPNLSLVSTGGYWSVANQVNYSSIRWNNSDYGPLGNDILRGYKLLIQMSGNLSSSYNNPDNTNQATNSYDIGKRALVNGVPIKDIAGSNICYPSGQSFLYFYINDLNITYTENYFRPTLYIPAGTLFMNSVLPEMTFVFDGIINERAWRYVEEAKDYTSTAFNEITWNNRNGNAEVYGNKKGLLLSFNNNLSNVSSERSGSIRNRDFSRTELGRNLKLNGQSFSTINGAEIRYYEDNKLWIYAPNMTNGYGAMNAEIELTSPCYLLDSLIPSFDFMFNGTEWVDFSSNTSYLANYVKIDNYLNNRITVPGYGEVVIHFDKALGNERDSTNLANSSHEIGTKLKINNVPIKDIEGSQVSYYGSDSIFVRYPLSILESANYTAHLTIEKGCKFLSSRLGEVSIYYGGENHNGRWFDSLDNLIATDEIATITKVNEHYGMKFESQINLGAYAYLLRKYEASAFEMGTIVFPLDNYVNSGAKSIREFYLSNTPSSTTYNVVRNTKLDFSNKDIAHIEGYYKFSGAILDIKPSNIEREFVGVGFIKVNGDYYFGNDASHSTNYFTVLLNAYRCGLYKDSSIFKNSINLSTNEYSHCLDDVSAISSNHLLTKGRAGRYLISALTEDITKITLDGKKFDVNIPKGTSIYVYNNNGYLKFESDASLKYGIAEPTKELFAQNQFSDNRNSGENLAILSQAFGSNITRIWVDVGVFTKGNCGLLNSDGSTDNVQFNEDGVTKVRNVINSFKSRGQQVLLFLSGRAYLRSDKIAYYKGEWLSMPTVWANGISKAPSGIIPYDTEEEYQRWLQTQRFFFDAVLKEFPNIDAIETNNEIDLGGATLYRPYYEDPSNLPSTSTIVRWAMDINKVLTDSVKANAPYISVYSPALTCAGEIQSLPYKTSTFLNSCYEYINNYGTKNTDDYFTVLNMHPYLFPTQDHCGSEGAYLFSSGHFPAEGFDSGYMPYKEAWENADYAYDWEMYLTSLRNIMNNYNDNYKPASITEWGLWDMEKAISYFPVGSDDYWDAFAFGAYFNYNNRLTAVCESIYEVAKRLDYLDNFMYFRMFDYEPTLSRFVTLMQGTYGLIYDDLTLKDRGKAIHAIMSGSNNHNGIISILNGLRG